MKTVLVTGASGLIGRQLVPMLVRKKYRVRTLGTSVAPFPDTEHFRWNPLRGQLEAGCLDGVTDIIHLAGAGIADKRWTANRKTELQQSRIDAARLLWHEVKKQNLRLCTFISASATGYYGCSGNSWLDESRKPGSGFLAQLCVQWEEAARQFANLGARVVCLRTGIVISGKGGALAEFEKTMRLGVAGYFTAEPLWYSWIDVRDLCSIYLHALQNNVVAGSYNAVAPHPLPMKQLIQCLRDHRYPAAVMLPVPAAALRLAVGEVTDMLLCSQRCASDKIRLTGFCFRYPQLEDALHALEE